MGRCITRVFEGRGLYVSRMGAVMEDPLSVGAYGALEGDLGESLMGSLGFSADVWDVPDGGDDCLVAGFCTGAFSGLRYVSPDQAESWGLLVRRLDV